VDSAIIVPVASRNLRQRATESNTSQQARVQRHGGASRLLPQVRIVAGQTGFAPAKQQQTVVNKRAADALTLDEKRRLIVGGLMEQAEVSGFQYQRNFSKRFGSSALE
jgi:hypothetical protein